MVRASNQERVLIIDAPNTIAANSFRHSVSCYRICWETDHLCASGRSIGLACSVVMSEMSA